jgi:hypothetical protein
MSSGQRKGSFAVIEGYLLPAAGRMTGGALGPELALVDILRRMAREAVLGRAFIDIVDMAGFAGNAGV